MPLCVSCRGEYWAPTEESWEAREQPKGIATSPSPSSGLAKVYDLEDLPPFICARCHQSNERWHRWATASGAAHFSRFFFQSLPWGWLALGSFGLPLLALAAADLITPVASIRIGIPLAILLIFVNVALLYALKESLWRYDLMARVGRGFRPPLALLAVTAFVLALVFGLAIAFMAEGRADTPEAPPTEGLLRVTTTILLSMTFVNVTLSAIFMAGHDYGRWLNRKMPQPIYAQERRLLGVIEDGLQTRIRQATGKQDEAIETAIVDIERTHNGGVILMVSAEINSDKETFKQLQTWKVTTDRWGRVRKMSREGPPQYIELQTSG